MIINPEEELSKIDVLKLLMERSHAEARLFWTRNHFMFITSTALLGTAFFYFFIKVPTNPPPNEVKTAVSFAGLFVTLIWFMFNKVGRRMNHVYMQDAKNLAKGNELLLSLFAESLGNKTPSESVKSKGEPFFKKIEKYYSATMINYIFIVGFICAWLYILLNPIIVVCS